MTTLKTPLPEKYVGEKVTFMGMEAEKLPDWAGSYNQLIDYLAELTEVVEGLSNPLYTVNDDFKWEGEIKPGSIRKLLPTTTLKETLLEYIATLKKEAWFRKDIKTLVSYQQGLKDVEAIINRLIP